MSDQANNNKGCLAKVEERAWDAFVRLLVNAESSFPVTSNDLTHRDTAYERARWIENCLRVAWEAAAAFEDRATRLKQAEKVRAERPTP